MRTIAILAVSFAVLGAAGAAAAQTPCPPRQVVVDTLTRGYGEAPVGRGIARSGRALTELWVNAETGSWTVVVTRARDGASCLVADGEGWHEVAPPAAPGDGL